MDILPGVFRQCFMNAVFLYNKTQIILMSLYSPKSETPLYLIISFTL